MNNKENLYAAVLQVKFYNFSKFEFYKKFVGDACRCRLHADYLRHPGLQHRSRVRGPVRLVRPRLSLPDLPDHQHHPLRIRYCKKTSQN